MVEFYDKTLYELSIELDAYNLRWEERWAPFRALYTLIYNQQVKHKKKAWDLIPFPSEAEEIAWQQKWQSIKDQKQFERDVKGRGDGSRVIS